MPFNFVALLGKMYKEITTLDAVAPHARLVARNRSMTSNFLLNYSNAMFGFIEAAVKEHLNKIVTQLPQNKDSLVSFVKPFTTELLENVKRYLSNLEVFLQSGAKFMGDHTLVFTHDIIRRSGAFWTSLLATLVVRFGPFLFFFLSIVENIVSFFSFLSFRSIPPGPLPRLPHLIHCHWS